MSVLSASTARVLHRVGLPDSLQQRLRCLCALVGTLAALGLVGGVMRPDAAPVWRGVGLLALAAIIAARWTTYRRGRRHLFADVVEAVAVLVVGAALVTPPQVNAVVYPGVWFRSLYGTHRNAARYVALQIAGLLTGMTLSSAVHGAGHGALDPTVLGSLPALVGTACLVRVLFASLAAQDRAAHRERVLGATSSELLVATDLAAIRTLVISAVRALLGDVPRAQVLLELPFGPVVASSGLRDGASVPGALSQVVGEVAAQPPTGPFTAPPALASALDELTTSAPTGTPAGSWQCLVADGDPRNGCLAVRSPSGLPQEVAETLGTLLAAGVQTVRRTHAEQELQHRAWHDSLTGLPNRARYQQRARTVHDRQAAHGGRFAVALLDLDDFKTVNDTLGHTAGDELLLVVAQRLRSAVRGGDVVARLGGDEFALVLSDVPDEQRARELGARVLAALDEPVRVQDALLQPGASLGVAISEDGLALEELLRRADIAMYAAKAAGKNRLALFDAQRHSAFLGPDRAPAPGGSRQHLPS